MRGVIFAVLILWLVVPALAEQDYYIQWTDSKGVVHFGEDEDQVPKKYQHTIKKYPRETLPETKSIEHSTPNLNLTVETDQTGMTRDAWEGIFRSLLRERKQITDEIKKTEKEYNSHAVKSPHFFHQTYAQKREILQELRTEIEGLEQKLAEVDAKIEAQREHARHSGVPLHWIELVFEEFESTESEIESEDTE